jgi:hypothetical protein
VVLVKAAQMAAGLDKKAMDFPGGSYALGCDQNSDNLASVLAADREAIICPKDSGAIW